MAVLTDEMTMVEIDSAAIDPIELAQRVAILKRFKTLLSQQRDRFNNYLVLLDKQQGVIESGSAEDLLSYVEIEEKIVADIFSIQKVIDPLEEMYYSIAGDPAKTGGTDEVPSLKASLENLKTEAVIRSTKNKELLSKRMVELRQEIKTLRNNPYAAKNTFGGNTNTPSMIDLKG